MHFPLRDVEELRLELRIRSRGRARGGPVALRARRGSDWHAPLHFMAQRVRQVHHTARGQSPTASTPICEAPALPGRVHVSRGRKMAQQRPHSRAL